MPLDEATRGLPQVTSRIKSYYNCMLEALLTTIKVRKEVILKNIVKFL